MVYSVLDLKKKKKQQIIDFSGGYKKNFVINTPASVEHSANSNFIHEFSAKPYVLRVENGWPENITFRCIHTIIYSANDGSYEYMNVVWEGEFKVFRKSIFWGWVVLIVT